MPRRNNLEKNYIILIPSHNELESLKKIYSKIRIENLNCIIIDDNSSDMTHIWLKKNKAIFLKNNKKMGYEKSLIIGFNYIIKKFDYKYIITFDADGEHKVKDLKKIINYHIKKKPDILICNRQKFNRWSEYILSFVFNILFKIKDPLSGLKIYNIAKLKRVIKRVKKNQYLVDIISIFKDKKYKIKNFKIDVKKRVGNSKIGKEFIVNLKILSLIRLVF